MTGRQFSAIRTEIGTEIGQLTGQMRLNEEAKQKATDIRYELGALKARKTQFEGLENRM